MKSQISYFLFLIIYLFIYLSVFLIHLSILSSLNIPIIDNYLVLSYFLNFVFAGLIITFFLKGIKSKSIYTGIFFMIFSGFKFLAFLIFLYPAFKEDGLIVNISFEIPCSVEFMQKDALQIELNQQISKAYPKSKIEIKFINQIN